ncbi:MAG: Holliday junction branch migration protein RuvA [Candidatus Babeliales bacterium]
MIGFIQGTIKKVTDDTLLVLAGSLGFEISVPHASTYTVENSVELYLHTHWNQDQGPSLYGFQNQEDKTIFLLALKCPGVGPRLSLCIIETLGADSFIQAISGENIAILSSIPGIGKKKAEQLIVQLKHHVAKVLENGIIVQKSNFVEWQKISEVLNSLNYSRTEISFALDRLKKEQPENISFDVLLRKALSYLSKRA